MRDGWVDTTLGEVASWSSGKNISKDSRVLDGEFAIVGANGEIGRTNKFLYDQPLVVVGRVGSCGETYLIHGKVWISDNALIALPNTKIDITYLYYLLKTFDYNKIISGTTQPLITQGKLKTQSVLLPPLTEQKRIVDLISSVDSYIEALQQQVGKARKSRNALLNELLTKGGDGWVETTLGNICDFINGDRGKNYPSAKFRQSHGIPFINAGHLDNGVVNFADMDFISDEVFERLGGGKIHPGDTLFCLRGSVGKFANVGDLDKGAIASSLVIIRPNFRVTKDFLMHYLDSELCASELKQSLTGAVQPNLSANNLKSFKVFLPNIETQNEIGDVLSHFNNLITLIDHLIASTKKLRSALLSDLLSGNHEIPTTYDKHIGAA